MNMSPETFIKAEIALKGLLLYEGFSMGMYPTLAPPMKHKELLKDRSTI